MQALVRPQCRQEIFTSSGITRELDVISISTIYKRVPKAVVLRLYSYIKRRRMYSIRSQRRYYFVTSWLAQTLPFCIQVIARFQPSPQCVLIATCNVLRLTRVYTGYEFENFFRDDDEDGGGGGGDRGAKTANRIFQSEAV